MNLFDLGPEYLSHPQYPFIKHVRHVADMFVDRSHKLAAEDHDFGKLSRAFQKYILSPQQSPTTKHALKGALYYLLKQNLALDKEGFAVFYAILRHHGDLPNVDEYISSSFADPDDLEETVEAIESICKETSLPFELEREMDDLIDLFDTDSFTDDNNLNGLDTYFKAREVFSKLIFADKYEAIFQDIYPQPSEFKTGLYIDRLLELISKKQNEMSTIRNRAREEIIKNYQYSSHKQIFIIEAPTGLGKTFTALHLALEIAKDKNKQKIINALPMTSIIDQTHQEYSAVIDNQHLLKFHHLTNSKSYDEEEQETEQAGEENETRMVRQKNDYIASSWCNDTVIVTTFNQLFYAVYSNKNRDLIKFWTLRDSVIIMDEIQAVPRILLKDFVKTIEFLAENFNIDFILMSATIPAIKNFICPDAMAELLDNKYYEMSFNNRYGLSYNGDIKDVEKLADEISRVMVDQNSVLCVVNTKKTALELYNIMHERMEEEQIFLLSTNHIPIHRKLIIGKLKKRLGDKDHKEKTLLISTQVIEAGVDLDFDYGFREFAPLSSVIQTAGRVNREGGKADAKLIVTDKIGRSPYDDKDMLAEDVKALLGKSKENRESQILPILKEYFQIAISKTSKDYQLLTDMENLNFESVFQLFNERFMKEIPHQIPMFIEVAEGLYEKFANQQEEIIIKMKSKQATLAEKMEYRAQLKEVQREISNYVINVNASEGRKELPAFFNSNDLRWCPHQLVNCEVGQAKYNDKKGWINNDDGSCFF